MPRTTSSGMVGAGRLQDGESVGKVTAGDKGPFHTQGRPWQVQAAGNQRACSQKRQDVVGRERTEGGVESYYRR